MSSKARIGIFTGGGDCPGLNAVIRSIVKTAINDYDMSVIGFKDGYEGIILNKYMTMDRDSVVGILTRGGTILGTSNRADPFNFPIPQKGDYVYLDRSSEVVENYEKLGLDALIAIGGDGTMISANKLSEMGLNIIGVPKTIDNDLWGTDQTFGFDSAMVTATEAVDKIHTTAQSHHRVMIIEVMGRYAGWLALASGLAGGGDIVLIPEIPYDLDSICDKLRERNRLGKNFSIIVIGEGAAPEGGSMVVSRTIETSPDAIRLGGVSNQLASQIEGVTKLESRVTILGHLVRGGSPTPFDRILGTRYGCEAIDMVARGEYGRLVALQGRDLTSVALTDVAGKIRKVSLDHYLIKNALSTGLSLGVSRERLEELRKEQELVTA
ncbi:MAG: ATP-dependent 6-phosphofructokinase [candidate division Zixibacteria bacterium]|nr:ATP-dependent 6-phosphofructokinase [candidate division Zixibacteria bacterium]